MMIERRTRFNNGVNCLRTPDLARRMRHAAIRRSARISSFRLYSDPMQISPIPQIDDEANQIRLMTAELVVREIVGLWKLSVHVEGSVFEIGSGMGLDLDHYRAFQG